MHADTLLSYQIFSESLYRSFDSAPTYYWYDGRVNQNPEYETTYTTNNGYETPIYTPKYDTAISGPLTNEQQDAALNQLIQAATSKDAFRAGQFKDSDKFAYNLYGMLSPEYQQKFRESLGSDEYRHNQILKELDKRYGTANPKPTQSPAEESTSAPASPASNEYKTIEQQIDDMGVDNWIKSQGGMKSFVDNAYSGTYRHGDERKNVWGKYYDELQGKINSSDRGQEEIASWNKPQTSPPVIPPEQTLQGTSVEQLTTPENRDAAQVVDATINGGAPTSSTAPTSDPYTTRTYDGDTKFYLDPSGNVTTSKTNWNQERDAYLDNTLMDMTNPEHRAILDKSVDNMLYNSDGGYRTHKFGSSLDQALMGVASPEEAQGYYNTNRKDGDKLSFRGSEALGRAAMDRAYGYYQTQYPQSDSSSSSTAGNPATPTPTNNQQGQGTTNTMSNAAGTAAGAGAGKSSQGYRGTGPR